MQSIGKKKKGAASRLLESMSEMVQFNAEKLSKVPFTAKLCGPGPKGVSLSQTIIGIGIDCANFIPYLLALGTEPGPLERQLMKEFGESSHPVRQLHIVLSLVDVVSEKTPSESPWAIEDAVMGAFLKRVPVSDGREHAYDSAKDACEKAFWWGLAITKATHSYS